MNKLLIVGTVAFDSIKTPFGSVQRVLGGSGMYIGISSSLFEIKNSIVSVVGSDFPQKYLDIFNKKKIDISKLEIITNGKTFFWDGVYHKNMNHRDTLITELNVLANFKPVVPKNFKDSSVVLLGNLHPKTQIDVINQIENKQAMMILDTMNYWMDVSLKELKKVISMVDLLCINDQEAQQLTGQKDLHKAAQNILKSGPKYLIIKKGEFGSILFSVDGYFECPVFPTNNVVDPTGAGDTFAGGLSGYLTTCDSINFEKVKRGIVYGTALASFCIEDFGPNNIINLDKSMIDKRFSLIKSLLDNK